MPEPPPIYALTGNIGAGKSTVARLFAELRVPTYFADAAAKRLMTEDAELIAELKSAFGEDTYLPDGSLNRAWLAKRVFNDLAALDRLNGLVHPVVHRDAATWRSQQTAPYLLYEAAIVLEIGRGKDFAGIIVVTAPYNERRTRVRARDQVTDEQFAARAAKQWPDARKEAAADFLIHNDGKQLLLPQVLRLHRQLLP
ncbi:MAG: dephospho-CoA kinase [Bacteroidota bacterium]